MLSLSSDRIDQECIECHVFKQKKMSLQGDGQYSRGVFFLNGNRQEQYQEKFLAAMGLLRGRGYIKTRRDYRRAQPGRLLGGR